MRTFREFMIQELNFNPTSNNVSGGELELPNLGNVQHGKAPVSGFKNFGQMSQWKLSQNRVEDIYPFQKIHGIQTNENFTYDTMRKALTNLGQTAQRIMSFARAKGNDYNKEISSYIAYAQVLPNDNIINIHPRAFFGEVRGNTPLPVIVGSALGILKDSAMNQNEEKFYDLDTNKLQQETQKAHKAIMHWERNLQAKSELGNMGDNFFNQINQSNNSFTTSANPFQN